MICAYDKMLKPNATSMMFNAESTLRDHLYRVKRSRFTPWRVYLSFSLGSSSSTTSIVKCFFSWAKKRLSA